MIHLLQEPKLCEACTPLAATTVAQLNNRIAQMASHPQVQPYSCTECGSTDWATTGKFIDWTKPPEDWNARKGGDGYTLRDGLIIAVILIVAVALISIAIVELLP